ncbi:MAG: aminoacyl-histidine dipeptidase [Porphyromonas sp.]|nr:aminoacyl-histidine dipeptidase [Bacteroidales bacterium]MDY3100356.1 aminoacyl-histidine dipeptidase [Porphyromonas sp.]
MAQSIKELAPASVWSYFYDLTQIPRPTFHAAAAAAYVKAAGEKLGLETHQDEVGNVLIRKPATPGYENRPTITMQGHCDMVPQANSDKKHDFEKDPITTIVDGDWVHADQTTLGADNGIGVAMGLAVMADDTLKHGPLELLVTMDEEVGMVGAFGLKPGFSKGDILLNLDSELEGQLYIGCAGGVDINVSLEYEDNTEALDGDIPVRVFVKGLKGGHSGVDIHLGRANANKLIFRFLKKAVEAFDMDLASMEGGSLRNAIPREASCVVMLTEDELEDFTSFVADYQDLYNKEYKGIENPITFGCERLSEAPGTVIPEEVRDAVINAIEAVQNGVITYLVDFPDTVEASSNLASIRFGAGKLSVSFLTRSSSDSRKEMVASSISSVFELIGAKVELDADYSGWQPDAHSHVLEVMQDIYAKEFGNKPDVKVMHAGLECGIIQGVMPNMQMISFGPTILHPHSPDEKVQISTVQKTYKFLTKSLEQL